MNISIEQLIHCVKEATEWVTVCVPTSRDFFDTEEWAQDNMEVVCPSKLIDELEKLMK